MFCRTANRAGVAHRLQQVHEGVAQGALAIARRFMARLGPLVREIDVLHGLKFAL
jgi:hypothetical protein